MPAGAVGLGLTTTGIRQVEDSLDGSGVREILRNQTTIKKGCYNNCYTQKRCICGLNKEPQWQ